MARRAVGTVIAMRRRVGGARIGGHVSSRAACAGAVATLVALIGGACGDAPTPGETWSVEAWVCRVPSATTSPWYAGLPVRREISPDWFAERVSERVPAYVDEISDGHLRLEIVAGGELTLGPDEGAEGCIESVVARTADTTRAVVVVADAEHVAGQPGGLGGERARSTTDSRGVAYAYVGAADVAPSWGDDPPMDLVEHEFGHALGWRHSGSTVDAYDSALDVMSDSAAPRRTDPTRRDAPWPIAAHLLASGWLAAGEVMLVEPVRGGSTSTTLAPLSANGGRRAIVLPLPSRNDAVLTVEYREPVGYDSHLLSSGIAVHRVEFSAEPAATRPAADSLDWGMISSIVPLTGSAPFTDLLGSGDSLVVDGWTITAGADGQVIVGLVSAP